MEDISVSVLRDSHRNLLKLSRRNQRTEDSDLRRAIPTVKHDSKEVEEIISKLKTKSLISYQQLKSLKNSLLEDEGTIKTVLNSHGSLRGLIRELSGQDVKKQCEAAGCCCNLALGDEKANLVIAKSAGPYLVTGIDSLSMDLAVTCAWALGNIAASGKKSCDILVAQGVLSKFIDKLQMNCHEELLDSILYGLGHFVEQLKEGLSDEHLEKLLQALPQVKSPSSPIHIIFLLALHPNFTSSGISTAFLDNLLDKYLVSTQNLNQSSDFMYLTRILANMCTSVSICDIVVRYLVSNEMVLVFCEILLSRENEVTKSLLWLIGNLFNFASDSVEKNVFFSNLRI